MRIKLYENRDFMRRTQIKLMQEEVHGVYAGKK